MFVLPLKRVTGACDLSSFVMEPLFCRESPEIDLQARRINTTDNWHRGMG